MLYALLFASLALFVPGWGIELAIATFILLFGLDIYLNRQVALVANKDK